MEMIAAVPALPYCYPVDINADTVMPLLKQFQDTEEMSLHLCTVLEKLTLDTVNELFEQMAVAQMWTVFPEMLQVLFSRNENVRPGPGFVKPSPKAAAIAKTNSKSSTSAATLQLFSPKTKCMWSADPSIAKITAIVIFFEVSRKQRRTFLEPIVKSDDFIRLLAVNCEFTLLSRLLMIWMKMSMNDAKPQRLPSLALLENSGIDLCAIGMTEYVQTLQFYPREVWMGWNHGAVGGAMPLPVDPQLQYLEEYSNSDAYLDIPEQQDGDGAWNRDGEREAWSASPADEGDRAVTPPIPVDYDGMQSEANAFSFGGLDNFRYSDAPEDHDTFLGGFQKEQYPEAQAVSESLAESGLFEDFGLLTGQHEEKEVFQAGVIVPALDTTMPTETTPNGTDEHRKARKHERREHSGADETREQRKERKRERREKRDRKRARKTSCPMLG